MKEVQPKYEHLPCDRPDLVRAALEIWEIRPDLREHAPESDSPAFWTWLNTSGFVEYESVRNQLPPCPPKHLIDKVSIGGLQGYLGGGKAAFSKIIEILEKSGHSSRTMDRILDFGCGCGRCLRYLLPYASRIDIHGTDPASDAIEWCRRNLDFATFHTNSDSPPLPFGDATFDLVYCISVFTHLSEKIHLKWIKELRRIIRPGGLMIATTCGPSLAERIAQFPDLPSNFNITVNQSKKARLRLSKSGFAFVKQKLGHLNPRLYGFTFISPNYIKSRWCRGFTHLDYQVNGLDDLQDVVVLQRL